MVAYSFQRQFVDGIEAGTKLHTIRADRRRHARPGEELQLYYAMRTRQCELIARRHCTQFLGVTLRFYGRQRFQVFSVAQLLHGEWDRVGPVVTIADPDAFARADGFGDLEAMGRFWRDMHGRRAFHGFLVGWGPSYLASAGAPSMAEPDPSPTWSCDPFSATPHDVARAIARGGWIGGGLRRYRSLADGRVCSYRREGDELALYDFTPRPGGPPIGPYAELDELAIALIRYDRQRADDAAWREAA